jgi:hypothetical protein
MAKKRCILMACFLLLGFKYSFSQQFIDTTNLKGKLITNIYSHYYIGDQKVKQPRTIWPYLKAFPESNTEFRRMRKNFTVAQISLGLGLAGLVAGTASKSDQSRRFILVYLNSGLLTSMIYFTIKGFQHQKKAIRIYNQKVGEL